MKNLIKKAKKVVVGASVVALTAVPTISEAAVKQHSVSNNKERLVKSGSQELEFEEQFKNSPYLYQKYSGRVDAYIKDAKNQEAAYSAGKTKVSNEVIKQIIAKRDKMIFEGLCGADDEWKYEAEFKYRTEIDEQGQRHLIHDRGSHIICIRESGYSEFFVFNRDHCVPDRRICNPQSFGADIVCGCHGNHDLPTEEDRLSPILDWNTVVDDKPSASLNKAKEQNIAMIQSMLYVKNR
ncbi:MAG: hypothetical protein IJL05_03415 [Alphaproteobacteria bacterium]|nr:hypothetical protein [Alphaproteobacteria bacterium]